MFKLIFIIITSFVALTFIIQNVDNKISIHFLLFQANDKYLIALLIGAFSLGIICNVVAALSDVWQSRNNLMAIQKKQQKQQKRERRQ